MKSLKWIFGYVIAAGYIFLTVAYFFLSQKLEIKFINTFPAKLSPKFTGGEVTKMAERGTYKFFLQKPVFDALIGQTSEGFLQIGWTPLKTLPAAISEDVVLEDGKKPEFHIDVDTKNLKGTITNPGSLIFGEPEIAKLTDSIVARIKMHNPSKQ
ncbi:MAG: hypothetical protein HQM08_17610 [Candidatus Riflebacteria bacterium]|nr:hypothetical protein [Candidatus Riflebacteria bacterium]